jgi:hypothetical protein
MRKQVIADGPLPVPDRAVWLDLQAIASVEVTSEAPEFPVESALALEPAAGGWRAAVPGEQTITVVFDTPQRISRIFVQFVEPELERTQEFALSYSRDRAGSFTDIVRQQWNFNESARSETEVYRVQADGVTAVRLTVIPDVRGGDARASLARLRIGGTP